MSVSTLYVSVQCCRKLFLGEYCIAIVTEHVHNISFALDMPILKDFVHNYISYENICPNVSMVSLSRRTLCSCVTMQ